MKTIIRLATCLGMVAILILSDTTNGFSQTSQTAAENKALSVGDKLPPQQLTIVDQEDIRLDYTQGKPIILDFWNTSCSACVDSWPKLLALQKEFGDKIQIILVNTSQSPEVIRQFIDKRKRLTGVDMTLPMAYNAPQLTKEMFPFSGLPHVVWIDQESKVAAISAGGAINAKNIQTILDKKSLKLARKIRKDELVMPDSERPLFINRNGGDLADDQMVWFSMLTKGNEMLRPTLGYSRNGVLSINGGIKALYQLAYSNRAHAVGGLTPLMSNRVSLHAADSSKYLSVIGGEIQTDNMYIYQLIGPPQTTALKLNERFQADLKLNFGLEVSWEEETKICYVISRSSSDLPAYQDGAISYAVTSTKVNVNKLTVRQFISRLEDALNGYYYSSYPIVDETGYKGLLGRILFEGNIENVDELSRKLEPFGMKITREMRSIDVLQLRETKESSH